MPAMVPGPWAAILNLAISHCSEKNLADRMRSEFRACGDFSDDPDQVAHR
jgi:hypothetical protein